MALTDKLSAIGNAIREKGGTTALLTLDEMPIAIGNIKTGGGGGADVEPIVLSGDCSYSCGGDVASIYIDLFGNTITTNNITSTNYMFNNYRGETVPFDINCSNASSQKASFMFYYATNLKELPKINNLKMNSISNFFNNCYNLRTIPADFTSNWDWSYFHTNYYGEYIAFFSSCYSLRSIPQSLLKELWSEATTSSYAVNKMFFECFALDEIDGFNFNEEAIWKSNVFSSTFSSCYKLSNLTFATNDDGTAKTAKWKSQTIDLTTYVGYGANASRFVAYNSGLTASDQIFDNTTYQERKNGDWFTTSIEYSRYNHDSAVNTINSLPDTSAYLAANGGTNTIKFKGAAGSKTDGGAINTLTEAEIAVAAAKGWTVSLV